MRYDKWLGFTAQVEKYCIRVSDSQRRNRREGLVVRVVVVRSANSIFVWKPQTEKRLRC